MKQFNSFCGILAAATLTIACADTQAGITSDVKNELTADPVNISQFDLVADNTMAMDDDDGAKPAMGGEGDDAMGGNAPDPEPDRTMGTVMDDAGITAAVKTKLLADPMVSGLKIDVDTRAGVVYLTGDNMKNQGAIDQAMKLAKGTSGVKTVESKLAVGDVMN